MVEHVLAIGLVSVALMAAHRLELLPALSEAWMRFLFLVSLPMG